MDTTEDRYMQRIIIAKANRSLGILREGLERHLVELGSFNMAHKRITRYGLWDLFTDEELLKYNPNSILEEIKEMNRVDVRLMLNDATRFYLKMRDNVEGPYSSIIKRKLVISDSYKKGRN